MSNKLLKDGVLLLIAKLVSIGSGTLIAVFVARHYGVSIYGEYTTAVAFSTFILTFTDLGLDTFMLKECSRDKEMLSKYYSNILLIKFVVLTISVVIMIYLANILGYEKDVLKLILILIPNSIINYIISTFFVVMQIENRLATNAKIQIIQSTCIILIASSVVIFRFNIYIYAMLQSLISLMLLIMYVCVVPMKFRACLKYTKTLIIGSIFFGLSSLLYIVYYKVDTVMLSILKGTYEVGIYESAYKIVNILISLIVILDNLIMPKFFQLYKVNKNKLIGIYEFLLKYGFIFGIPFSVVLMFMSTYMIDILYGYQYSDSIIILQILIWTVVIRLLAAISGFVITASDNMHKKVKFQLSFAILNIILNVVLIPIYGVGGAAVATVTTELMVFITYYIFVRRTFGGKIYLSILGKCLIMNIVLVLILNLFKDLNFILMGMLCTLFYLVVTGIFFRIEFKNLLNLILNKNILKKNNE